MYEGNLNENFMRIVCFVDIYFISCTHSLHTYITLNRWFDCNAYNAVSDFRDCQMLDQIKEWNPLRMPILTYDKKKQFRLLGYNLKQSKNKQALDMYSGETHLQARMLVQMVFGPSVVLSSSTKVLMYCWMNVLHSFFIKPIWSQVANSFVLISS